LALTCTVEAQVSTITLPLTWPQFSLTVAYGASTLPITPFTFRLLAS